MVSVTEPRSSSYPCALRSFLPPCPPVPLHGIDLIRRDGDADVEVPLFDLVPILAACCAYYFTFKTLYGGFLRAWKNSVELLRGAGDGEPFDEASPATAASPVVTPVADADGPAPAFEGSATTTEPAAVPTTVAASESVTMLRMMHEHQRMMAQHMHEHQMVMAQQMAQVREQQSVVLRLMRSPVNKVGRSKAWETVGEGVLAFLTRREET